MKQLLILSLALTGCLDSTDPVTPPDALDRSVLENCGRPPQHPQWSYTPSADGNSVIINAKVWADHEAWVIAIADWSLCADHSQ